MRKQQLPETVADLEKHVSITIFSTTTPGIHGDLKIHPEDFVVCEITPIGRVLSVNEQIEPGEKKGNPPKRPYTLIDVVKRNEDTILAAEKIAQKLKIESYRVSWAGLKDNRAITSQRMTIQGNYSQKLSSLEFDTFFIKNIRFLKKPIKLGDLWGNKFDIIMRNIKNMEEETLKETTSNFMSQIAEFGFPNYYGLQRFGSIRPNSHLVGKYLFLLDYQKAVEEFLYATYPPEHDIVKVCRTDLKKTQDFQTALQNFPEGLYYERLLIRHLSKKPNDFMGAIQRLPRPLVNLLMSSYQSYLFNCAISVRMNKIGNLIQPKTNDIICLLMSENGLTTPLRYSYTKWKKPHLMKALETDRARILCPILGYETKLTNSHFAKIYSKILKKERFKLEYFKNGKQLRSYDFRGSYRSIIVKPKDLHIASNRDKHKSTLRINFSLPKGTYATMLLRELSKH